MQQRPGERPPDPVPRLRVRRGWPGVVLLAWALLAPLPASAAGAADELLDEAARLSDEGEYEGALAAARTALKLPEVADATLVAAWWRVGEVSTYLRRDAAARDAFERVLTLDPAYEPPKLTPPKVRALFTEVRGRLATRGAPRIRADPPDVAFAGLPAEFRLTVERPTPDDRAVLVHRPAGGRTWTTVEAKTSEGALRARVAEPAAGRLEWYAELRDSQGLRRVGDGGPLDPKVLEVAAPKAPPKKGVEPKPGPAIEPWVWAVVGGVVVVGGIVTFLALQPQTGTVEVRVTVTGP